VALLALIAGTVSYLHMHLLVELHGRPGWVAALTPLSVDGMIVAASTTLLADSRSGCRGSSLSWLLLGAGSVASLAANVAVAEPSVTGKIIAAWPSFALIGSYELLMRQIRATAATASARRRPALQSLVHAATSGSVFGVTSGSVSAPGSPCEAGPTLREEALRWAIANRGEDGRLPSGKAIAEQFGRHERWGRLVKHDADDAQADANRPNAAA
jgi:Protein of unknown function (DUF2637)